MYPSMNNNFVENLEENIINEQDEVFQAPSVICNTYELELELRMSESACRPQSES